MGIHSIRMPDIGEGIAETEIAEWLVGVGQTIREDDPMVAVMTDKATVEIPSPVTGKVLWLAGEPGDKIAVGSELIRLEVDGDGNLGLRPTKGGTGGGQGAGSHAAVGHAGAIAGGANAANTGAANAEGQPQVQAGKPLADLSAAAQGITEPDEKNPATNGGHVADHETAAAGAAFGRPGHTGADPFSHVMTAPLRGEGEKPVASPSVRGRARDGGVDLRLVRGSGPGGRITHDDLDAFIATGGLPKASGARAQTKIEEIKVIGLRRRIAERMQEANQIPSITIIEEIDATALEDLRARMNVDTADARLTMLPFIARALVRALRDHPAINQLYLPDQGVVRRFGAVHLGIATQTPNGLMVPVLRHAEAMGLRDTAAEIARLAQAARDGSAKREELAGSTITVTSLGVLGAVASTPILNAPEVAIIGINRLAVRPFWNGTAFEPRKMMNISCSFDHRVIDGWDAAVFVARLKELMETPALIFVEA